MKKVIQLQFRLGAVSLLLFLFSCQKQLTESLSSTIPVGEATVSDNAVDVNMLVADWETGNTNQWYGLGLANPAQYATVTWPVAQGKYAGKFTVRPGDVYAGGERCEVMMWTSRSYYPQNYYSQEVPGKQYFYGWSTQFPNGWVTPPGFCIFMQFQQRANSLNPAISFNVYKESIQVNFNTGHVSGTAASHTTSFAYMPTYNSKACPTITNSLARGKWHDFIVDVKYAPDNTGIFEVWHRVRGSGDFKMVVIYRGVPTETWTTDPGTFLKEGVYTKYKQGNVYGYVPNIYVKLGLYRPVVSGNKITNTLYHDNWFRTNTFANARARFP